jgi:CRISPR/Cas system-associated exonuclease Cas4 (RecB family)
MRNYLTVSASSLSTFFRCSQQYKWQYVDELEPDEGVISLPTVFGKTFHKALELHFKFGIKLPQIISSWKILFLSFCTETGLILPGEYELQTFIDKGCKYLDDFFGIEKRWSDYKILDIEKYFKIPYKNSILKNVFLTGRIDLILNKFVEKTVVCLDWKTSKYKEADVDKNIQLTFYIYFMHEIYRYNLDSVYAALVYPFDQDILFTQRTKKDLEDLFAKIDIMLERIVKSDFRKEPKLNFSPDDCFFCQYQSTCKKRMM